MSLMTVYDAKGEMFEVPHERGAQLVLNQGWTRTAQVKAAPVVAPKPPEPALAAPPPVVAPQQPEVAPAPPAFPSFPQAQAFPKPLENA